MRLIARIRGEQAGAAVAIAMAVLTALLAITGLLLTSAVNVNTTSKNDSDPKRAYAAAEAGTQAALYKLNKLNLSHLLCLTDLGVNPTGTPLECPSFPAAGSPAQSLGNGTSYRYTVTPVLSNINDCRDPFTIASTLSSLLSLSLNNVTDLQRCITSTGYAGGEQRRVQMLVVSTLKVFEGITADDKGDSSADIDIRSGVVTGQLGTNGKIRASGSGSFIGGVEVPKTIAGDYRENSGGVFTAVVTTRNRPWVLSTIDPGSTATINNNTAFTCTQALLLPCSPSPYTAATRSFHLRAGQTATFTGPTYNFCNFQTDALSTLNVNLLGNASVYLDSPDRGAVSNCAAGSGNFSAGGTVNPLTGLLDAQKISFFVYGTTGKDVTVNGSGLLTLFTASIYAPSSTIRLTGDVLDIYKGAFAGKKVVVSGPTVTGLLDLPITLDGGLVKLYRPAGLKECKPEPASASDPESGCPTP